MRGLTPEGAFAQVLSDDPSRPFITYYDEDTGERSELSARSLANWVAKTHFLLSDELGLGVGDTALVALPAHWISAPIVLGCLSAGLTIGDEDADVAFVTPDSAGRAAGMLDAYAIAPDSAAVGLRDSAPPGTFDYVAAVRPQADAWAAVSFPAGEKHDALPGVSRADLMRQASAAADAAGLSDGGRLLTTRGWTTSDDLVATLVAALAVGGSLVIVRNAPDADVVARRAHQERATAIDTG